MRYWSGRLAFMAAASIFIILLGVSVAFSQSDFLIVPGERISWMYLDMDACKILQAFGETYGYEEGDRKQYLYERYRFGFNVSRTGRVVAIATTNPRYHLEQGISIGTSLTEVTRVLGAPNTSEMRTNFYAFGQIYSEVDYIIFNNLGVAFLIHENNVVGIDIFIAVDENTGRLRTRTACYLCAQFRYKGFQLHGSNIFLCDECVEKGVHNNALCNTLYFKVRERMESMGMSVSPVPNLQMQRLEEGVLGRYSRVSRTITVTTNLKVLFMMGVMAHEYAHGYHHKYNPRLTEPTLCEGFATWAEVRFYNIIGRPELGKIMLDSIPDFYVQGYNYFRNLEAEGVCILAHIKRL